MSCVPRWYWPAALLPALIVWCLFGAAVVDRRLWATHRFWADDTVEVAFSVYVALVLISYLLLLSAWRCSRQAEREMLRTEESNDGRENV